MSMNPSIRYGGGIGFGAGDGLGDGGIGVGNGLGTGSVGTGPGLGAGIGSETEPTNELSSPIATINPNPTKPHNVRLIIHPFLRERRGDRSRVLIGPEGDRDDPGLPAVRCSAYSSREFVGPTRGPFESRFMGLTRLEANLFSLSRRLVIWIPLRAIKLTIMPALRTAIPAAIMNSRVFECCDPGGWTPSATSTGGAVGSPEALSCKDGMPDRVS